MKQTDNLPPFGKTCPRCGHPTMFYEQALNALSRRDNKTFICSGCGTEEGLFDMYMDNYASSEDYDPQRGRILMAKESSWLLLKEIVEEREAQEKENT